MGKRVKKTPMSITYFYSPQVPLIFYVCLFNSHFKRYETLFGKIVARTPL